MKKISFSLPNVLCGVALLMTSAVMGQRPRGPITPSDPMPLPNPVTTGFTHCVTNSQECYYNYAEIGINFEMQIANFYSGVHRTVTNLYQGDLVPYAMGQTFINQVYVSSVTSPTVALGVAPYGFAVPLFTNTFFSAPVVVQVTSNHWYRATTTLQRLDANTNTFIDVYTTPLSPSYTTLDRYPWTTFGDYKEITEVKDLKIGTNFGFQINGNTTYTTPIVTCAQSPLILDNVINWYGNSGNATLTLERGFINGGVFSLNPNIPPAIITFPVTGADLDLTALFSLSGLSGSYKVTYKLPDDDCNGTLTPVTKSIVFTANTPAFLNDYKARSINVNLCPGVSKPVSTSWNITTPMPTGATMADFRCAIKAANGWAGAGSVGINALTFFVNYAVDVYEVDPITGIKLPNAPSLFRKNGTTPTQDDISFNESAYSAGFDATNYPYYVDINVPADPDGNGTGQDYFKLYYAHAKTLGGSALTNFSAKVFCAEVSQFPAGGCVVNMKSYFRIANSPLLLAGTARFSNNSEENETIEYLSLELYPNPTSGELNIPVSNDDTNVSLIITDNLGKQVLTILDVKAKNGMINIENLAPGIYFYSINKDNSVYKGKIVKQ